jgi:guanylate kinase
MKKQIIITGPGASGKDYYVKHYLKENPNTVNCIFYTTRPMRKGEEHGKDYYFVSEIAFKEMDKKDLFLDVQNYNNWFYGLPKYNYENSDICIMTPDTIKKHYDILKETSTIIYLDIPEQIRKERLSKRNDSDSVDRRLKADFEMFKDFNLYHMRIVEPNF